ncbi:MAG: hypothetical protein WBP26_03630 [Candidatus Saccharimonadales bacterium]
MPIDEATSVLSPESEADGMAKFHMAVALCGKTAALTVIAREFKVKDQERWGMYQDFSVHPVDNAALAKLTANRDS